MFHTVLHIFILQLQWLLNLAESAWLWDSVGKNYNCVWLEREVFSLSPSIRRVFEANKFVLKIEEGPYKSWTPFILKAFPLVWKVRILNIS